MKNKVIALAIGLAFLAGYVSHDLLIDVPEVESIAQIESCKKTMPIAKGKVVSCGDELDKVQALYGKAFNLFLINLGFHLSRTNKSNLSNLLRSPQEFIANQDKEESPREELVSSKEKEQRDDFSKSFKPSREQAELLNQIDEKDVVLKGLNSVLKDPALAFARSKHIDKFKKIKKLNGTYRGKIYFFTGTYKSQVHDVEMSIDYSFKETDSDSNKDIDGSFSLKLISEKGIYSNSRGTGGNGDIRIIKNHLLVEAGPSRFFSFKKNDLNYANFYIKNKHVGFAKFEKN